MAVTYGANNLDGAKVFKLKITPLNASNDQYMSQSGKYPD